MYHIFWQASKYFLADFQISNTMSTNSSDDSSSTEKNTTYHLESVKFVQWRQKLVVH